MTRRTLGRHGLAEGGLIADWAAIVGPMIAERSLPVNQVEATLLPALIYAGTVLMYIVKRRSLPPTQGFSLGRWELPVIVLASVWLVYELLIFRDESFAQPRLYVLVMVAIGAVYLAYLLIRYGVSGLTMPELADIDRALDIDTAPQPKGEPR